MTTKVYIIQEKLNRDEDCWGYMEEFESIKEAKNSLKKHYSNLYVYRIIKRTIKDEVVR